MSRKLLAAALALMATQAAWSQQTPSHLVPPLVTCQQTHVGGSGSCQTQDGGWSVTPYGSGMFMFGPETIYINETGSQKYQMPTSKGSFQMETRPGGEVVISGPPGAPKGTISPKDAKGHTYLRLDNGSTIRCIERNVDIGEGVMQLETICKPYRGAIDDVPPPADTSSY